MGNLNFLNLSERTCQSNPYTNIQYSQEVRWRLTFVKQYYLDQQGVRWLTWEFHLLHVCWGTAPLWVPTIITESCITNTTTKWQKFSVPNRRIRRSGWMCLFFDIFSMKINRYFVVSVSGCLSALCWIWLRWCAVLWHLAEKKDLCICCGTIWTAGAATE